MKKYLIPAVLVAATVWACSNEADTANNPARPDFLASNVDSSVNPAQDFFLFANGGWIKRNPIPGSESSGGIGNLVDDEIKKKIRKINEDAAAAKAEDGTETQKIGDFWIAAMDSTKADQLGISPLQKELERINGITDVKGLIAVNAGFESLQTGMFYYFGVGQDAKNSGIISAQLWQGGLGLPNRDYYFSDDENPKKAREEYPAHISRMLVLAGIEANEAKKAGEDILKFETALAKSSRKLEELRDPEANYNKMTTVDVTKNLTPSIDWAWMFTSFGMTKVDSIV
ncbi:MAG: M13 family metallopeptidase, partial [Bacteroidia bacterium]